MVTTYCQPGAPVSDLQVKPLDNPHACFGCPCLTPPINEYTYCVLKKVCRKILKEICQEKRREVYTIFDGGTSMKYEPITKGAHPSRRESGNSRVSEDSLQKLYRQQKIKRLCGSEFDMKKKKRRSRGGDGSDDSADRSGRGRKSKGDGRGRLGHDKSDRDAIGGYSGQDRRGSKSRTDGSKIKKGKDSKSEKGKIGGKDAGADVKSKENDAKSKAHKETKEEKAERERLEKEKEAKQKEKEAKKAEREKAERERAERERAEREKAAAERAKGKGDKDKGDKDKGDKSSQMDLEKKRKDEINGTIQSRLSEQQRRCARAVRKNTILMVNRPDIDRDFAKRQRIGSCGQMDPQFDRYEYCPKQMNICRPCYERPRPCFMSRTDAIRPCDYLRAHMEYRDMCCPRIEIPHTCVAPPVDPCSIRCNC